MKLLRNIGLYLGHLLTAVVGTAILTTPLERLFRGRTITGVVIREWILGIVCAGVIGFLIHRTWRSRIGLWIWILAALWFACGLLLRVPSANSQSVFSPGGGIWFEMSGLACHGGLSEMGCRNFFLFTIPLLRAVGYALGTLVGIHLLSRRPDETSSAADGSPG